MDNTSTELNSIDQPKRLGPTEKIMNQRTSLFDWATIPIVASVVLVVFGLGFAEKLYAQSRAAKVIETAHELDFAINMWAFHEGKDDGDPIAITNVVSYAQQKWADYISFDTVWPLDPFGNDYLIGVVGSNQVKVSGLTKQKFRGIHIDWEGY